MKPCKQWDICDINWWSPEFFPSMYSITPTIWSSSYFTNLNLRYLLGRIPYINHHFTVWFDEVAISWHRIIGGLPLSTAKPTVAKLRLKLPAFKKNLNQRRYHSKTNEKAHLQQETLNRVRYSNTHHLGDSILWVCVANCMYGSDTSWKWPFQAEKSAEFFGPKAIHRRTSSSCDITVKPLLVGKGSKWSTPRGEAFTPRGIDFGSWRSLLRLSEHFLPGLDDLLQRARMDDNICGRPKVPETCREIVWYLQKI